MCWLSVLFLLWFRFFVGGVSNLSKARNWTVKETIHWLTSYFKLSGCAYLFQKANISRSLLPRIFEPNFMETYNLNYTNSSCPGVIENVLNTIPFGPSERNLSLYLTAGILTLFGISFTSILTICLVRFLLKPGKSTLKHESLSKYLTILQALEKNLSHEVKIYDSKSSGANSDNPNNSNQNLNSFFDLNWNEINKTLDQSEINMVFSNTQFSTLVSSLRESYIIEIKYLLDKVNEIDQRLSVAEEIVIESKTKKCLLRFPCYSKKYTDKEFYMIINTIKNKVSDLKHQVINHKKRWRCILTTLNNSCTSFNPFQTIFETETSENFEQFHSLLKDTYDNPNEIHEKLDNFTAEYIEDEIKLNSLDENVSVFETLSLNDDFHEDSNKKSDIDVAKSYSDNSPIDNANKQNCSDLHSTKIPTFIHLPMSSKTPSKKWKSGSSPKKHRFFQSSLNGGSFSSPHKQLHLSTMDHVLPVAHAKRIDISNVSLIDKSRISSEGFTDRAAPTTGLRKPKPIAI
ncbi:unnamed protein product [Schistosoma turkestanicum]|nr:unnamed protein product [Schistosoma turkestanicum]CAH8495318.1 unnamed protein product [Schistosoma turkestanicum]